MSAIVLGTLGTVAIQVCTSIINAKYDKENLDEIKRLQEEAKRNRLAHGLQRDYEKFQRACQRQIDIEEERQQEEIKNLCQNFYNAIQQQAHKDILEKHYPLNISPYVINYAVIPVSPIEDESAVTNQNVFRKEIFCILTNSNNAAFNNEILPAIDEKLCDDISRYWNQNTLHTICYFTNTWKGKKDFRDEDIENLKTVIKTPTITISPYFEYRNDKYVLCIKINIWGSNYERTTQIESSFEFDKLPASFSQNEKEKISQSFYPLLLCSLAYCVDIYYWATYFQPPVLPILLANNLIAIDDNSKKIFEELYCKSYDVLVLGNSSTQAIVKPQDIHILKEVSEINQYSFPNRSRDFLSAISLITSDSKLVNSITRNTIISLYEVKSAEKWADFQSMDATVFDRDDLQTLSLLRKMALTHQCEELAENIRRIIVNNIKLS